MYKTYISMCICACTYMYICTRTHITSIHRLHKLFYIAYNNYLTWRTLHTLHTIHTLDAAHTTHTRHTAHCVTVQGNAYIEAYVGTYPSLRIHACT